MTVRSARSIYAMLALCALLGAGCVARDATESEKSNAVARQAPVDIDGVPLRDWLQRRTALLVCGAMPTAVEHDGERWQVTTPLAQRGVGLACAVPIGTDGCFLTSAHNLRLRPVCVCVITDQGVRWAEATVVAVGDALVEGDDLAVVRADLPVVDGFELSEMSPQRGTVVYAAGQGVSAGRTLHVRPCPGVHSEAVVYHDAPTGAGDSGGPVVDGAGRLVGVTSRITSSWRGWRVAAVRPSAELLAHCRR